MPVTNAAERALHRVRGVVPGPARNDRDQLGGAIPTSAPDAAFVAFERVGGRASIAFRLTPADVERFLGRRGFFATPHGRGQWVSLWADGPIDWDAVSTLIDRSYRVIALSRMLKALESPASPPRSPARNARRSPRQRRRRS